ncbi:MAG TPA: methylmalonyl-CoA mutase family protein, partial [Cyclobacteriaceae bacterium]|nr:methylmalonyl-CoA mutase family protein [Cyclobacteriaceae bacterium]
YDRSDSVEEKKLRFSNASWLNVPKVIVSDQKKANDEALIHLNAGADGIWFEVLQAVEPNKFLNKIELSACSLFFSSKDEMQLNLVADFIESKSINEKITGAFFLGENKNIINRKTWRNFHTQGIIVNKNEDVVDEIVDSLLTTVDRVERLMKEKFSADEAFRSIAFSISVNADFFLSIAKIRALKNLWITLQEAYEIRNPIPAFIHGHSQPWIKENFQPHGSMLKQTTAGMACAMSGCNAITVEPESFDNKMMSRIARNTVLMLREESHLAKVNDPLAGSFYVDALTHQIAGEAWKRFQQR